MDLKDIQIWIWIQIDTNTSMNFETIMKIAILNKNRLGGLVENIEDMYFKNSILRRQFSPESPIVSENKSGCGDQRGALLLLTVGQWHRHLDLVEIAMMRLVRTAMMMMLTLIIMIFNLSQSTM